VGRLLAMARETGGGPVRRGGARRTATLSRLDLGRETRAGPAHQRGRRGEGRVGRPKATGPAARWAGTRERGGGPRLGRKPEMGQSSKRNSFRISIDFFEFGRTLKNCTRDLGEILTWGFFLKSSRLLKDF
jgi:hypothetical protein